MIRDALVYHVYSGHLFFTAAVLFTAGVLVRRLRALTILAIPLAALSGTPLPVWLLTLLAFALGAFFAIPKGRPWTSVAALAAVALSVALELPYHVGRPRVLLPERLFVIGDSLASGGFGEAAPWPIRLGATNLARASDTAESAREQVALLPPVANDDCVIVEIGGNDMLEGTPAAAFASGLEIVVRGAEPRRLVMLELPLIPGAWRYGLAQRRIARAHGVVLVPKRIVAAVLADRRNSFDGLHLNDRGHARLARDLGRWLRWTRT